MNATKINAKHKCECISKITNLKLDSIRVQTGTRIKIQLVFLYQQHSFTRRSSEKVLKHNASIIKETHQSVDPVVGSGRVMWMPRDHKKIAVGTYWISLQWRRSEYGTHWEFLWYTGLDYIFPKQILNCRRVWHKSCLTKYLIKAASQPHWLFIEKFPCTWKSICSINQLSWCKIICTDMVHVNKFITSATESILITTWGPYL